MAGHNRTHTHTSIHILGTIRDANIPTMHVFELEEKTGALGGNPRNAGRTCAHRAGVGIGPPTLDV